MKQNRLYLMLLLALLGGCRQMAEENSPETEGPARILEASLEGGADTKTQLGGPVDGIYYPYWSETDELAVYADGLRPAGRFTLQEGAGTAKALFKGNLGGEKLVALYPYKDKVEAGLDGNVLSLELPAKQTYAEGSFADGAFPMLAVSTDGNLSFLNLCATLKVSLTGDGVSVQSIRFKSNDGKMAVCGPATVRTDFDTEPQLQMASGGAPEVVLECGCVDLDPVQPTDFYLVIPPGTYKNGFELEIKTFTGTVKRSTNSSIQFLRSQMRAVPAFACVPAGGIDPDNLPYNQIWYKTNGSFVFLPELGENIIVSNEYADGWGVITCKDPILFVPEYAFYGEGLTEIHLPDCVESIESRAFANTRITTFRTPAAWKKAGSGIFMECKNLTGFTGPRASADGRAVILENGYMVACVDDSKGGVLQIPAGAKILQMDLFYNGGLSASGIVIPEGVETIEGSCFRRNPSLKTVHLPGSVTEVQGFAFADCDLDAFTGDSELIQDGRALVDRKGYLTAVALRGLTEYRVPEGVTFISSFVFSGSASLKRLTFPSTLASVWEDFAMHAPVLEAFYGPMATADHHGLVFGGELKAVTPVMPAEYAIPDDEGIVSIGYYCFSANHGIQHLTVPDEVTTIGTCAFSNMSQLRTIRLPAYLTELGYDSFMGCHELKTVYLRSFTPPAYEEDVWGSFAKEGLVIYVPKGYEEQYKNDSAWAPYASYIQGYEYTDLEAPDYYISTDYSLDGGTICFQKASEGAGIDLVLLGDAFSDRQVAGGEYESVLLKMMEAFFSEEPYKSYRHLFNVYGVNVVSSTEGYDHGGQALSGWFGDGTYVGGDNLKCIDYARKVVAEDRLDNTLIIVAMNARKYAGTCWMYDPTAEKDWGEGLSVAYFPLGDTDETLAELVHHEAGGHGFGKLADEYAYSGTMPSTEVDRAHYMETFGWWKNVDFTSDPAAVKWHRFLEDSRYAYDGLGVFEGAFTYANGVWRPTDSSIMRYNTGGFNAPSREAIWYRLHKLAFGSGWTYDYEAFVSYDARNRKTGAGAPERRNHVERTYPPLHPPVVAGPRPKAE